jgi:hypothetical protein
MTRPTNTAKFETPPILSARSRALLSDAERAERGRAQVAAGDYLDDDELDAFLDSLILPDEA